MKKRLLSALLAIMVISSCLTACGDSSSQTDASKTDTTTTSDTTTTTTTATTTQAATTTQETTTTAPQSQNRVVLDLKNIQAKPELPKGSEITCATMLLNYYGFNVDKMKLLEYLPISEGPDENGVWVTAYESYLGNPKLDSGYGCYNTVVTKAKKSYWRKESITGYKVNDPSITNFVDLYDTIKNGDPVIIWATDNMEDVEITKKAFKTADMGDLDWRKNQHCYVLIGFDKDKGTAILSDPLDEKGVVEYPEKDVAKVYDQLNCQALVIRKE